MILEINSSLYNSKNIFSLWLCARWLLLVDTMGRFPAPSAKPTVSNP